MPSEPPIPVELWEQVPPAAQAALLAVLARSEQRLAEPQAPSDDLRQRLNTNSTNSSKPRPSAGPQVKRPPAQPRSGRPRGGQPGHPRQQRPRLQPTQTHALEPDFCLLAVTLENDPVIRRACSSAS